MLSPGTPAAQPAGGRGSPPAASPLARPAAGLGEREAQLVAWARELQAYEQRLLDREAALWRAEEARAAEHATRLAALGRAEQRLAADRAAADAERRAQEKRASGVAPPRGDVRWEDRMAAAADGSSENTH